MKPNKLRSVKKAISALWGVVLAFLLGLEAAVLIILFGDQEDEYD
jgi:uncharacterized membrane protein YgaE (UPF0421/DUF939 family)